MLSGEVDVVSSTVGIMKDYIASGDAKVIALWPLSALTLPPTSPP